jgi:hypothetical protein
VRILGVLAFAILLGGCLGASTPATHTRPVEGPRFRLLVVDDEQRPIPNATVFFGSEKTARMTDELGEVWIENITAAQYTVRAWAPAYYRAEERVPAAPNGTGYVVLKRRPDDKILFGGDRHDATCFLAAHTDQASQPCMSSRGQPVSWTIALTNGANDGSSRTYFHNLSLTFEWTDLATGSKPRLEARLAPDGAFADGSASRAWTGPGPYVLHLGVPDLGAEALDGDHKLVLTPGAQTQAPPQVVTSSGFESEWTFGRLYKAAPNPSWTE